MVGGSNPVPNVVKNLENKKYLRGRRKKKVIQVLTPFDWLHSQPLLCLVNHSNEILFEKSFFDEKMRSWESEKIWQKVKLKFWWTTNGRIEEVKLLLVSYHRHIVNKVRNQNIENRLTFQANIYVKIIKLQLSPSATTTLTKTR